MYKVGIRGHDLVCKTGLPEFKSAFFDSGFDCLQLVISKSLDDLTADQADAGQRLADLPLAMLGAYFNPVHPDSKKLEAGLANFKRNLDLSVKLKTFVGTETGSLMGDPWGYVVANHNPETVELLLENLRPVVEYAEKIGAKMLLEGAWSHVCGEPKILKYVVDSLNYQKTEKIVYYTVDLFNYLNLNNYADYLDILQECLGLFDDDIKVFHLKNFNVVDNQLVQCGLSKGFFDYSKIMGQIRKNLGAAAFVFEGVTGQDIRESLDFIRKFI
jgi:sugar phosphate isomerase/epimerase